jgi:hypothetical protein
MNDIKPELDIVFESVLYRALSLGYSRQRAEDLARNAVADYFNTAK